MKKQIYCTLFIYFLLINFSTANPIEEDLEIKNSIAFTKLYGYIKYFHPSKKAVKFKKRWTSFALYGLQSVKNVQNEKELLKTLQELYTPLAPEMQLFYSSNKEVILKNYLAKIEKNKTTNNKISYWKHVSLGLDKKGILKLITKKTAGYESKIIERQDFSSKDSLNIPHPEKPLILKLTDSISILLPLALYDFQLKSALKIKLPIFEKKQKLSSNIVEHRVPILIQSWTIFQHFYPYFEDVNVDWQVVLKKYLYKVKQIQSGKDFDILFREMLAEAKDGHVRIGKKTRTGFHFMGNKITPLEFGFAQGSEILISKVNDLSLLTKVTIGDRILKINDENIPNLIEKYQKQVSASTSDRRLDLTINKILNFYVIQDSVTLTIQKKNKTTYKFKLSLEKVPMIFEKKPNFIELEEGYFFINLGIITYKEFTKNIEKFKSAKGLIFDLREYPHLGTEKILTHFYPKNILSTKWETPIIYYPDFKKVSYQYSNWNISAEQNQLKTKIIFLINSNTISYGESIAEIIKYYKIGLLLGSRTAGTNGNMNFAIVGNGYQMGWTGMKVRQRDGSAFHGVGVEPQIKVKSTVESISNQQDNLIFEALKHFKKQL